MISSTGSRRRDRRGGVRVGSGEGTERVAAAGDGGYRGHTGADQSRGGAVGNAVWFILEIQEHGVVLKNQRKKNREICIMNHGSVSWFSL